MRKRTATLTIEVDLDSTEAKEWGDRDDFFENEVDDVIRRLSEISTRRFSKLSSEKGRTEGGSKFKVIVKRIK